MKKKFQINRRLFAGLAVFVGLIALFAGVVFNPMKAQEKAVRKTVFEKYQNGDAVTEIVRNEASEFVRVKINGIEDRAKVSKLGTVIEDYGSFVILAKDKSKSLETSALDAQTLETSINLPSGKFELPGENSLKPDRQIENLADKDYYIVQFAASTRGEWLESLEEIGAEVVQYIPHQAYFVYADSATINRVANHSRVRFVGRYAPEQKRSLHLENFVSGLKGSSAEYDVAVFSRADLLTVRDEISNMVGRQVIAVEKPPHNFFSIIRVQMAPDDVENVAKLKDVVRIDPYVKPQREDERAAQIVSGNFSSTTVLNSPGYEPLIQFGVDGTGVTVAVVDDGISIPGNGGFYITSGNTVDGPLRGATAGASGGHGHINASIIAGDSPFGGLDPTGYNYGRGIAPKANIINIAFLKAGNTTTDAQSVDDTLNTLGPNGVRGTITNNSWGAGTNGNTYSSRAALWDGFVQDASLGATIDPINIIFSAGNSGASGLTQPKMSKNTIAVANSENIRTEILGTGADNMDDLRSTSSRGPGADGRIKPDITAPGTAIAGSRAGTGGSVSGQIDANHSYSSGTSHAAPQVAGAAALFTQYWKSTNSGEFPSPSLVKAAILNTGQEMNGSLTTTVIPNGNEGWGRMNMRLMLNTGVPMNYTNQTVEFSDTGNNHTISGTVSDATKPVRVTLVWTDPPGVSDPALVNNLDLTVRIGSDVYKGNVFVNGTSATGGTADNRNNVENVFIPAGIPAGTPFSIQVSATALNGNGILGNADSTDQHFSLVVYNYTEQTVPETTTPFDYDGDSKTDISIYRPSLGQWWIQNSSDFSTFVTTFGISSDKLVPADYTGDGRTDIAFFRPSSGEWFILRSENSSFYSFPFGTGADIPAPADFDGDGKSDPAVFRPSTGEWFILQSAGGTRIQTFGSNGDLPVAADYDGDGKADIAIYRPSNGQWWLSRSSAGLIVLGFGTASDKTVQGDYTGDGKADVAIWRPSSGEWFVLRSENFSFYSVPFGVSTDIPAPGDYDGDGIHDIAVFRGSSATWFVTGSQSGQIIQSFGAAGDIPTPGVFVR